MRPNDKSNGAALTLGDVLEDVLKETAPRKSEHTIPDSLMSAYRQGLFWDHEILEIADEQFWVLAQKSPGTAIRMVDTFGGTRLWIPAGLPEGDYLQKALNAADAQIVMGLYQNSFLDVPARHPLWMRRIYQRRAIATLRDQGWTRWQLAHAFRISPKNVTWILRERDRRLALTLRMTRVTAQADGRTDNTTHPRETGSNK
tara:strand:+ start:8978 stop:9580 length:603 start_codon:yes stop_codon:yes gene_type:complete